MDQPRDKAIIYYASNEFFIGVSPSGHAVTLDTHHERPVGPSPMELLLVALGSCTGVDVVSILKKKRQSVTEYRAEISGERNNEHPRGFRRMHVHHIVTGVKIEPSAVARAIELSEEKYCSVAATLRPAVEITSSFEVIEAEPSSTGST